MDENERLTGRFAPFKIVKPQTPGIDVLVTRFAQWTNLVIPSETTIGDKFACVKRRMESSRFKGSMFK